ncbi:MAG TPA: hypothetical protein VM493_10290 [Vicinamibacterales bacterium]|nr:hypothetical protein [Vicinamibacterales bacterium]
MANRFRFGWLAGLAMALALPTLGNAQDISLAAGGADPIWKGTQPNQAAGFWLDQGAVGKADSRRDLIVGAPGNASIPGTVFILFGGPEVTGEILLSQAQVIITSSEAGNRFGASTAAGNILNLEGTISRNLVIGAPGALGNRGAVYLMAAGFEAGSSTSDASATLRILGAPGDQLGTALATGDLDSDGYREIIVGAPGNSRIYVIKGGPSLSGTLDLSVTAAAQTYNAPGIGRVLTSGDITGDNIYDVVAGAPTQNVTYIFAGAAGSIPGIATSAYFGIDAGDESGTTVRILDLDADGQRDLVITAPGGDGPHNDRANAGEAYVFLGPLAAGAQLLSSSNIAFFGAAPGMRLGDGITAGDINRDLPNDLVLLGSGGVGGAGQLEIYYGRARGAIGVQQPDGRRFVDFANAGQASRKVYGDPAAGPVTSAQVFEVTGEGARDIIVGVAAADSGAGKLYFVISPKMRVTPTSVSLVANEGGSVTSPTPIQILNASTVFIGWQTTVNRPWLSTSPTAGSADATHPSSFLVTGASQGLTPGEHTGTVTVSSTSPDLEQSIAIDVTMTVTGTRMALDTPVHGYQVGTTFTVQGWALDVAAASGTGVSEVRVYAFPNPGSGQTGTALGTATYGGSRPDVGAAFGARFTNSAYSKQVTLAPGTYQISVFAKSTVLDRFMLSKSAVIVVVNGTPSPNPVPVPDVIDPGPTPTTTLLPPPPPPGGGPNADTRVAINRTSLSFGAIAGTNGLRSAAQQAAVTFSNGSSTWTASTDAPWLQITNGSGAGAGSFSATVKAGTYEPSTLTGTITVSAASVPNSPLQIPVTLRVFNAGGNPSGVVDTPTNNITGVTGAIAMTGWATDDIDIQEVGIYRDPIAGETASSPNGKIFIGRAAFVDGARPDVDAAINQPFDYEAGWGYMLLTNMLPNQGNGTFTLHAYATDVEGNTVLLGSRTITCDNANAVRPFGAIDTPDQGGTVSGTTYTNFGWALTPKPNTIPTDGSTILVYIDGVPVGRPVYNNARADIAALFPNYNNSGGAIGYYQFNTTTLANGVHTISWVVTDNAGNAEGIGSRYFTVLNGAVSSAMTIEAFSSIEEMSGRGADTRVSAGVGASSGLDAATVETIAVSDVPVYRRDGYNPNAALELTQADEQGVIKVAADPAGRFTLTLSAPVKDESGGYEGYLVANGKLQALPAGSFLDQRNGEFYWQPGVGFNGTYRLVFVRTEAGQRARITVDVTIGGQRPAAPQNVRIVK